MPSHARRQIIAVSVFLVVVLFFTTTFRLAVVKGDSMLPTFRDGQIVLVSRLLAFNGPLKKGDVVLVRRGREVLIKRVAFLSGEALSTRDSIRFMPIHEKFDRLPAPPDAGLYERQRIRVPKDDVVVLGDNPLVSDDSRQFGPVPLSDVEGRVLSAPPAP
jgi:signal peptidase I